MKSEKEYLRSVWFRAVNDAEAEVMRTTATPPGGRKAGETIEQYVARTRELQDNALAKYQTAQKNYRDHGGGPES